MPEINFYSLNEAICYWLGYQFRIGRKNLMHEASLRYPLADALTGFGIPIDRIALEKQHPFFVQRYIDILIANDSIDKVDEIDFVKSTNSIFELKICKEATGKENQVEHQRIINDILRLAYFNLWTGKDAYFIICGSYQDFKNYFIGDMEEIPKIQNTDIKIKERNSLNNNTINSAWKSDNSLYKDFFDFKVPVKPHVFSKFYTFKLNEIPKDILTENEKSLLFGFNRFQMDYKLKENKQFDPELKIKTTCMAFTSFESIPSRTHASGIWKIEVYS